MAGEDLDFRLLFEQSPDNLLVLLPDAPRFTMVAATRTRHEVTNSTPADFGRGLFEAFPDNPDDPAATGAANLRASLERVLATRQSDTMAVQKYDIRGPDGRFVERYWSPKNVPVLGAGGEILYILHRVEDVTDLVLANQLGEELRDRTREMERDVIRRGRELAAANDELRAANARLGELDAAKTAFFGNVSHEFRTPLTLILGPLEGLLADGPDPRSRRALELIRDNSLRLLKLVNALLDFSRLEAGRMRASFAPLDLATVTAELAGMFQSAVDHAALRLRIDCPPLAEPVWVDRDAWEKVVPNLVSNAFKFTFAGEIVVRTRELPSSVVVEVADTGVGIPESELERVFERFHRAAGVTGRTHEGTGIGLALVRELVGLHGGTISVTSRVGHGTTFRIEIPKGTAHLPPEALAPERSPREAGPEAAAHVAEVSRWMGSDGAQAAPPEDERPLVLVVDDNADLREYVAALLAPGYRVETAADGRQALERIAGRRPELVVSDVMMPNLDGFGLVRALRAEPATSSLPVILLSARAGEEAAVEGLDVGSDDYLVKPFAARELLARVRTHVQLARIRREWTTRLEAANRDLEAFGFSVAHDLRGPLQGITGFLEALRDDYAGRLDGPARDYLDQIEAAAAKMERLIQGLLDLGRVDRVPLRIEPVDLGAVAASIIAELRRAEPDRSVAVAIGDDLVARGDRALLEIVLGNLIRNAWKFTAGTPAARIELARAPGAIPTFAVRDNGAGFDASAAGELFHPYRRLHRPGEFEGTGVGLATVRRIVERHGGRISADAAVGRGATFTFTLPAPEAVPGEPAARS